MPIGMPADLPRPPMICDVAQEALGDSVVLWGSISVTSDARGRYSIMVRKAGPSGRSNLRQGGDFVAQAGAPTSVGRLSLSIEPGASFEVELTVEANGSSTVCRRSGQRP